MVYYVKQGKVTESRHTFDDRNNILNEELFGEDSFDGAYSLLYHMNEPTRVKSLTRLEKHKDKVLGDDAKHLHIRAGKINTSGGFLESRRFILVNSKLRIGIANITESSGDFYRNSYADILLFTKNGKGNLVSPQGDLAFGEGDYVYIPRGTTFRIQSTSAYLFVIESREHVDIPPRYLNRYGQLKEGTPYYSRDFRIPVLKEPSSSNENFKVFVEYDDYYMVEERDRSILDVVGWDGYLYPYAINVNLMAPIVGKLHMPPPIHETFSGKGFMVGTFLPRKFDFHPRSIPISYYHNNIDVDEVIFYASGNFMSRKGIEEGSVTMHVRGIIHGPQPGTIESSIGKEGTEELAVMVESYEPLILTENGKEVEDPEYMESWYSK
ncbi:MAG: homogentisate 1,2-dioxygenase [Thermoplasmataceae archaeon]